MLHQTSTLFPGPQLTALPRWSCLPYILQARELESWSDSPECFHHASDSGGWEDHLNLSAEHLYLTLLVVREGGCGTACSTLQMLILMLLILLLMINMALTLLMRPAASAAQGADADQHA